MRPGRIRLAAVATLVAAAALSCTDVAGATAAGAPDPGGTGAADPGPAGGRDRIGIRLLEAPVARRDDPRARLYIVDHVAPGATIRRRIAVSHQPGSAPGGALPVVLYPAAATIRGGSFTFGAGRAANELTGWTTLDRTALALGPGEEAGVTVTIAVPAGAVAGERYAVVWAQTQSTGPGQVRQVSRVGVRVYLDVGPGGEKPSDLAIGTVTARRDAAGVPRVTAEVTNTGARALDLTGAVALADGPGGVRAGPFPLGAGVTLGTGQRRPVTAVLDPRLPAGPWTATVTVRSGTVVRARTVTVTFPDQPAAVAVGGEPPGRVPWPAVAGAVLLVGLVGLGVLTVRRRRAADRPERDRAATAG